MSIKSLHWAAIVTSFLLALVIAGCSSSSNGDVEALEARVAELEGEVVSTQPSATVPTTAPTTTTQPPPSDAGIGLREAYCVGMFDGFAMAESEPAGPSIMRITLEGCLESDVEDEPVLEAHCRGIAVGSLIRNGDKDAALTLAEGCLASVAQNANYVELLAERSGILADDVDLFLELFAPEGD
jgi:hypothetical protein